MSRETIFAEISGERVRHLPKRLPPSEEPVALVGQLTAEWDEEQERWFIHHWVNGELDDTIDYVTHEEFSRRYTLAGIEASDRVPGAGVAERDKVPGPPNPPVVPNRPKEFA